MTRDPNLERELGDVQRIAPTILPGGNARQLVQPTAGDPDNNIPISGTDIPVSIIHRVDQKHPIVTARLEQITDPADDVRILTATPPGTGGITVVDHDVTLGYIEVRDLRPVLFNDGTIIKSDAPSTAQYSSPIWESSGDNLIRFRRSPSVNWQVILRLSTPIDDISAITAALQASEGRSDPAVGSNPQFGILFSMLKVDLTAGQFKLEDLTWDLAHKESGIHTTHGTLYDTAANFEDSASFAFGGYRAQAASSAIPHFVQVNRSHSVFGITTVSRKSNVSFEPPLTTGPYTGIHLYLSRDTIGDATLTISPETDSVDVDIRNPRSLNIMRQSWVVTTTVIDSPNTGTGNP